MTKTLQDADNEVRQTAREAFNHYSTKFPEQSDHIRQGLPANVKKMLARAAMSRSNSTESISSTGSRASGPSTGVRTPGRPKTTSTFRSTRNVSGTRTVKATASRPVSAQRPGLGSRGYSDLGKLHSFFSQNFSNNMLIIFFSRTWFNRETENISWRQKFHSLKKILQYRITILTKEFDSWTKTNRFTTR